MTMRADLIVESAGMIINLVETTEVVTDAMTAVMIISPVVDMVGSDAKRAEENTRVEEGAMEMTDAMIDEATTKVEAVAATETTDARSDAMITIPAAEAVEAKARTTMTSLSALMMALIEGSMEVAVVAVDMVSRALALLMARCLAVVSILQLHWALRRSIRLSLGRTTSLHVYVLLLPCL